MMPTCRLRELTSARKPRKPTLKACGFNARGMRVVSKKGQLKHTHVRTCCAALRRKAYQPSACATRAMFCVICAVGLATMNPSWANTGRASDKWQARVLVGAYRRLLPGPRLRAWACTYTVPLPSAFAPGYSTIAWASACPLFVNASPAAVDGGSGMCGTQWIGTRSGTRTRTHTSRKSTKDTLASVGCSVLALDSSHARSSRSPQDYP
jgi:hypothetical protein